jgi:predicted  nucleic acid-binding Zn-ribbon protein
MPNYFDYMLESADSSIDDMDDYGVAESVYNEMDASMCEFDAYVQEGVGLAIAAGVGGAALLGGLIALIVKCFGSSSPSSTAKTAKAAKKALQEMEAAGEPVPAVSIPEAESVKKLGDALEQDIDKTASKFEEIIIVNEGSSKRSETPSSSSQTQRFDNFDAPDRQRQFINDKIRSEFNKPKYPLAISTSVPTSYDDAYNRLNTIENVSEKLEKKNKDLKKTEQKVKRAESNGTAKTTPQQQQKLKQQQALAASNVSKVFRGINEPLGKLFSNVRAKGEKAAKMLSDILK